MNVGFTGTRRGMSECQMKELAWFLIKSNGKEFHHGDCMGADDEAKTIALRCGYETHIHPSDKRLYRAFCKIGKIYPEKPYLDRNKDIVDAADTLIAAPKSDEEELRSGTWSTIRYARKQGKIVHILNR